MLLHDQVQRSHGNVPVPRRTCGRGRIFDVLCATNSTWHFSALAQASKLSQGSSVINFLGLE